MAVQVWPHCSVEPQLSVAGNGNEMVHAAQVMLVVLEAEEVVTVAEVVDKVSVAVILLVQKLHAWSHQPAYGQVRQNNVEQTLLGQSEPLPFRHEPSQNVWFRFCWTQGVSVELEVPEVEETVSVDAVTELVSVVVVSEETVEVLRVFVVVESVVVRDVVTVVFSAQKPHVKSHW